MTYARRAQNMTPLALLAAALLLPSPASALTITGTNVKSLTDPLDVTQSTPAPPGAITTATGATSDVVYYLDLHASRTSDERFSLRLLPGRMATRGGRDEGESVDGPLQFTLYGPGEVGEVISEPQTRPICSERFEAFHGYSTGPSEVDVWLPAGADTTLAVRYGIGRRAPWVDTDLQLRFSFQQQLVGSYGPGSVFAGGPATPVGEAGTHTRTQPIIVAAGKKRGERIGAHLLLRSSPAGRWGEQGAPRRVGRRTPIRVTGQLLPKQRGKRVQLQWSRSGGRGLKTATTVRTGAGGRFAATLRPPGPGIRELWAAYPSQSGQLVPDTTSCPLRFRVG